MAELWPREPRLIPLWQQIGQSVNYHRWAGLSGATAIVFTAYLENDGKLSDNDKHFIALANQINYIHALVLLAMPIARRPNLVRQIFGFNEFFVIFFLSTFEMFIFCHFLANIVWIFIFAWNDRLLSWMLFMCPFPFEWIYIIQLHWWHYTYRGLANSSFLTDEALCG